MTKNPQQVELIMTQCSISLTEHQLNIHSKKFLNCLLITKNKYTTKIWCYTVYNLQLQDVHNQSYSRKMRAKENANRLQHCHENWKIRFREPGYSFERLKFLTMFCLELKASVCQRRQINKQFVNTNSLKKTIKKQFCQNKHFNPLRTVVAYIRQGN